MKRPIQTPTIASKKSEWSVHSAAHLAPRNGRSEDVRILAVIVAELKYQARQSGARQAGEGKLSRRASTPSVPLGRRTQRLRRRGA
jgi:hypothetical protein